MGESDDLSDRELVSCELVRVVPDVIDVLVSPSSMVTEICEVSPCCSDWEFVEPQSFLSSESVQFVVQIRRKRSGTKAHQ